MYDLTTHSLWGTYVNYVNCVNWTWGNLLDGAILKDLMVCLSRTKQDDGLTIPSPFTDMKVPKVLPKKTGQPCSCSTCHHVHHVQQESGVTKVQTNKKSLETQQYGRFLTTWTKIPIFRGSPRDPETNNYIGGGFKYVLFSLLLGEMIPFDYIWLIFFKWVETTNQTTIAHENCWFRWSFCILLGQFRPYFQVRSVDLRHPIPNHLGCLKTNL